MSPADSQSLPLISIIMPAFNAERFIESAIRSVLTQHYQNIELIIVNDASTDQTETIIRSFDDARIRYINAEKIGKPSGVRNKGLQISRGELIGFMDADDEFLPDGLAKLAAALTQHPDWMGVDGFSDHIDDQGAVLEGELIDLGEGNYQIPDHIQPWSVESILALQTMNALPAFLLRREAFERNGFFNEALLGAEDFEYKIRLFLNGLYVGRIPEPIYRYRVYATSVTKSAGRYLEILNSNLDMLDWFVSQLENPANYQALIEQGYAQRYYNVIRDQLNAGNTDTALQILGSAWKDARLPARCWLKKLFPLYPRCHMPKTLNNTLVSLKRGLRRNFPQKTAKQAEVKLAQ